jgi:hypothetical protein
MHTQTRPFKLMPPLSEGSAPKTLIGAAESARGLLPPLERSVVQHLTIIMQ